MVRKHDRIQFLHPAGASDQERGGERGLLNTARNAAGRSSARTFLTLGSWPLHFPRLQILRDPFKLCLLLSNGARNAAGIVRVHCSTPDHCEESYTNRDANSHTQPWAGNVKYISEMRTLNGARMILE